jgi:hypothetical protein
MFNIKEHNMKACGGRGHHAGEADSDSDHDSHKFESEKEERRKISIKDK